jgi:hypothetical protein|tara:strand:+ start:6796 stop:7131 length:336 start_codon:yes stop_codon:yes gene_type:complete
MKWSCFFGALDLALKCQQTLFLDQIAPTDDLAGLDGQHLAVDLALDEEPADVLQRQHHVARLVADETGRQGAAQHHDDARQADEAEVVVGGRHDGTDEQSDAGQEAKKRRE